MYKNNSIKKQEKNKEKRNLDVSLAVLYYTIADASRDENFETCGEERRILGKCAGRNEAVVIL